MATVQTDEFHGSVTDASTESARSGLVHALRQLGPSYVAYLMGPFALVAILVLMHFGAIVHESAWIWLGVFIVVPVSSLAADFAYKRNPSTATTHVRIAVQAATVAAVIYLTGWGPVLWGAFAFIALENVSHGGAKVWGITVLWSLIAIGAGQYLIAKGWLPSKLSMSEANALAIMGAFVLVFVIWMAGVTMRKKERAEIQMRLSEDRFRSLIQDSSDITMVMDEVGTCTYVSPASALLLGFEPEELVGVLATDMVHPDDRDRVMSRLGSDFQATEGSALLQFRMGRRNGTWCDVETVVTNQINRPSIAGYVAHLRDITERKEFEALLAHRALHDPLTGLANRQLILDRAEQMIIRARRTFDPIAVFFIDLDNFKDANDSLGHEAGDRLLQDVGRRLESILRASDTVGRLGGDEFVILVEGASLAEGPQPVADRIREVLRKPFSIQGFEGVPITVTASIGVAMGDRTTAQELIRDADIALYRCKSAGRDQSVLFEPAMQLAVTGRLELRSDLDAALANDQFFLLYQPIVDLDDGRIRGVEALLRWRHPTRGVIQPNDFIPILEDCGLIVDVGRWVLDAACAQAAAWRVLGYHPTMSVNVSMRQLESDSLVDDVKRAVSTHDLDPACLVVEVTETALMKDAEATVSRLRQLKELGVKIAIDDFGTGYSSLAYLRQFPVDVLKIDRSFISSMDGSEDSSALIKTMVDLGKALGLLTLAEGIEDEHQLECLQRNHCESGQGFMFSKPVEPGMVEALMAHAARSGNALGVPRPALPLSNPS
jgi:diguanylate cyclase (GGDEF)-like protein/PAS domain S-box-containing protein